MANRFFRRFKPRVTITTRVIQCDCENAFQDGKYGKNMRVHNRMSNGNFRCTVCLDVKHC